MSPGPASSAAERSLAELEVGFKQWGLDVFHPFIATPELDALFPFERFGHNSRQALLIGNSRRLWPAFMRWQTQNPGREHPINDYAEQTVAELLGPTGTAQTAQACYFSHVTDYPCRGENSAVPFQRLGQQVGLAALGPAHLSAHDQFGPWFAFRAVIILNQAPEVAPLPPKTLPCAQCSAPCQAALSAVLAEAQGHSADVPWRRWLALREACPVGTDERYGPAQLHYHYTKDPLWLKADPQSG